MTVEQVLFIHEQVIKAFGGDPTVLDRTKIEAAVAQPRMTFDGRELYPTLARKAAALGFSLIKGHPFLDGNKRTGIASVLAFLSANRCKLRVLVDEEETTVLGIADGSIGRDDFAKWLRRHMVWK